MKKAYFYLAPSLYAAQYREQIILLDIAKNNYLALDKETAGYFKRILTNEEDWKGLAEKEVKELNDQLDELLNQKIIVKETQRKSNSVIETAPNPIGLNRITWLANQKNQKLKFSFFEILNTAIHLFKITQFIRKGKLDKLFSFLKKTRHQKTTLHKPTEQEIEQLVSLLDYTCIFFPIKTLCLAWAATFVLLSLKKAWQCELVLGVQTHPFYAHAFVTIDKKVINDNPQLQERLAPIFKLCFN